MARWDPIQEMEEAWNRIGNLLTGTAGGEGRFFTPLAALAAPADIEETDDGFIVTLDVPGARRQDISVDLRENELMVSGDIKEIERKGVLRRQNRQVGRFEHRIVLPGKVNAEGVEATLKDGVLTVRMAKAKGTESRHIEVKS